MHHSHYEVGANVKDHTVLTDWRRGNIPEDELTATYEAHVAAFWSQAGKVAVAHGFDGVYQEGRSGGWAVPYPIPPAYDDEPEFTEAELEEAAAEEARGDAQIYANLPDDVREFYRRAVVGMTRPQHERVANFRAAMLELKAAESRAFLESLAELREEYSGRTRVTFTTTASTTIRETWRTWVDDALLMDRDGLEEELEHRVSSGRYSVELEHLSDEVIGEAEERELEEVAAPEED